MREQMIINQKVESYYNMTNSLIASSCKNGKNNIMVNFAYAKIKDIPTMFYKEKKNIAKKVAYQVMLKLQQCGYKTHISNNINTKSIDLTISWETIN